MLKIKVILKSEVNYNSVNFLGRKTNKVGYFLKSVNDVKKRFYCTDTCLGEIASLQILEYCREEEVIGR